ncbi:MAG: hypothetical protein V3U35_08905, partial [Candidatus Neomarinimicrobiota bacterium]
VTLNPVPLANDRLNLVTQESYARYARSPIDSFNIDSTTTEADFLLAYVAYSGGCKNHDFFLFGSQVWGAGAPPLMPAVIIHDGHWDLCEAYIHETLRFDLSPIRYWRGDSGAVLLHVKDAPDTVRYSY